MAGARRRLTRDVLVHRNARVKLDNAVLVQAVFLFKTFADSYAIAGMSAEVRGPVPTKQVFLYQIPLQPIESKIRFLGCVLEYDVKRGVLTLEHNFAEAKPRSSGHPASYANTVEVDINVYIESVRRYNVQVGTWVNVFGYVREQITWQGNKQRGSKDLSTVYVDAVVIIPAGTIDIGSYERILRDAQEVDRRVNRLA